MPQERPNDQGCPTGATDQDRPTGDGSGALHMVPPDVPDPPNDQGPSKALCKCGKRVLARGLCSTCYSRMRNHALRAGAWAGQPMAPGLVLSDRARAALSVLRIFRASKGYWPMGAELLPLARAGEERRNLASGLLELLHSGITAYQMTIVGLARRVVVPQNGPKRTTS